MNIFFDETSTNLGKNFLKGFCNKIMPVTKIITFKLPNTDQFEVKNTDILDVEYDETISSNYAGMDKTIPIDKGIIDSLNYDSLLTLKMIERFGSFKGEDDFEKRVEMFFNHVRFWNHIIEVHKIKIAIFLDIPHEPAAFIIYQLMRAKGKMTVYHQQIAFLDTYTFEETIKLQKPVKFKKDDFIKENIRLTIEEFSKIDYIPFYSKNNYKDLKNYDNKFKKLKSIINEIISKKVFFKYIFYRMNKVILDTRITNFLKKFEISPDLNKKYILIPLNYQPEATTSPKGDIFVYQSLMIKMISHSLIDSDWIIYIKEHPLQSPTFGRNLKFYMDLVSLKNVFFIKKNLSGRKLLLSSKALGIVSGTMGLEAIVNEIPVLCFGEIYYKFFHGVFPIETNVQLDQAILKIKNGFKPQKKKLLTQLRKIPSNYYHGCSNEGYLEASKIPYNQNVKNLVQNLNHYLKSRNFYD